MQNVATGAVIERLETILDKLPSPDKAVTLPSARKAIKAWTQGPLRNVSEERTVLMAALVRIIHVTQ
jgi:hypothetical protein